jgi:DNA-binding PadR family transcriptional regulator
MDLNMLEIITLDQLLRFGKPVVRHSLYVIINEYLKNKKINITATLLSNNLPNCEKKFLKELKNKNHNSNISTSSFYNNLNNLEKKGFIKFNEDEKGKIETIEATSLTKKTIRFLLQFFMDTTVIPDYPKFDKSITAQIQKRTGVKKVESLMAAWLEKHVSFRLISFLKQLSSEVFVLSKIENYDEYAVKELESVHFSKIFKNLVREPDNMLDLVVVPQYKKKVDFFNMSRIEILKEFYRIIVPNGFIVVVCKAEFPLTQDRAADELLNIYRESISNSIFSKDELTGDLKNAGFKNIEIFNHKGMLTALGYKEG